MRRRRWLQPGLGAAALPAVGGGIASRGQPGVQDGHLTPAGRLVLAHAGAAFLEGSLPADAGERAMRGLPARANRLAQGLAPRLGVVPAAMA